MAGFVSILLFDISKGDKQNNCARFYRICKYTFLIFEKGDKQKTVPGFVSIILFNI